MKDKIERLQKNPAEVALPSTSESSSEDIKDDEETIEEKLQKEQPKTQFVFINFDAIPRTFEVV